MPWISGPWPTPNFQSPSTSVERQHHRRAAVGEGGQLVLALADHPCGEVRRPLRTGRSPASRSAWWISTSARRRGTQRVQRERRLATGDPGVRRVPVGVAGPEGVGEPGHRRRSRPRRGPRGRGAATVSSMSASRRSPESYIDAGSPAATCGEHPGEGVGVAGQVGHDVRPGPAGEHRGPAYGLVVEDCQCLQIACRGEEGLVDLREGGRRGHEVHPTLGERLVPPRYHGERLFERRPMRMCRG